MELPLVPFGKYKGKPVTELLKDKSTLDYYNDNRILQKYPAIYNIVVNQTITTGNTNAKTPEHNSLQNLFIEQKNINTFIHHIYRKFPWKRNIDGGYSKFEAEYNWDVKIHDITFDKYKITCKCPEEDACECKGEYEDNDENPYNLSNLYIEIKPEVGDDYPCILRKMSTQIKLTEAEFERQKKQELDELGYEKGSVGGSNWSEIRYIQRNHGAYQGRYILFINRFTSPNITKEQLKEIFDKSRIQVVFLNEVFDEVPRFQRSIEDKSDLEKENAILRENLIKAQTRIKELEEKLKPSVKTKNTIEHFFKPK